MSAPLNQQPIIRTVGRRQAREGQPLTPADRETMTRMAQYVTRAPKGVFRYRSRAAMDADRLRWTVDAMVAKAVRLLELAGLLKTKQGLRRGRHW